ncbi:MAG: hypothetical protein HFG34_07950 [Eubacterium sp.]|nr:hypothetical protein [Eubacterium sp.]
MKRLAVMALVFAVSINIAACGKQQPDKEIEKKNRIEAQVSESFEEKEPNVTQTSSSGNILIAYFTWAENTHVENPDEVDTDATTSASVLPLGNTALLAGWIQEEVGGDLFSIVTEKPYSSYYDECLDQAAEEQTKNARLALVNHVENMDQYDMGGTEMDSRDGN